MAKSAEPSENSDSPNGKPEEKLECFILMPFSEPDGYKAGHFNRVYKQIFVPACELAGFRPVRGDEVGETNLIHLDILQRLLDSPMALCDLSTLNPNVLFELGLRQAFDKPVALVKEVGTRQIFDIAPLRYMEYRNYLLYEEVLEDQEKVANIIKSTWEARDKEGINSLVRLLSIPNAKLAEPSELDKDPVLQLVRAELSAIRRDFSGALQAASSRPAPRNATTTTDLPNRQHRYTLLVKGSAQNVKDLAVAIHHRFAGADATVVSSQGGGQSILFVLPDLLPAEEIQELALEQAVEPVQLEIQGPGFTKVQSLSTF